MLLFFSFFSFLFFFYRKDPQSKPIDKHRSENLNPIVSPGGFMKYNQMISAEMKGPHKTGAPKERREKKIVSFHSLELNFPILGL